MTWLLTGILTASCLSASGATEQIPAARIPTLQGRTLAGADVHLPADLNTKAGVLVVGFSQASRSQVTAWGKRLAGDYLGSTTVAYYEMPVLESVPKLLRGFVVGRIKADVSERARPTFLPVLDHEADWKKATGFGNEDDAYILLVDGAGQVRWRTQGALTDTAYAELQTQLRTVQPR